MRTSKCRERSDIQCADGLRTSTGNIDSSYILRICKLHREIRAAENIAEVVMWPYRVTHGRIASFILGPIVGVASMRPCRCHGRRVRKSVSAMVHLHSRVRKKGRKLSLITLIALYIFSLCIHRFGSGSELGGTETVCLRPSSKFRRI